MTDSAHKLFAPDLTKRPPRSPRQQLGGYALLPRMLDKGRADSASEPGPLENEVPSTNGGQPPAFPEATVDESTNPPPSLAPTADPMPGSTAVQAPPPPGGS